MDFKEWLLNESRQIELFHYLTSNPPKAPKSLVLDPKMVGQQQYTSNDMKWSAFPRVFFYVNPNDKESVVNGPLYKAVVPANKIYDSDADPLDLVEKASKGDTSHGYRINVGVTDYTKLMRLVVSHGYTGMYYSGVMPTVVWFKPIRVELAQ